MSAYSALAIEQLASIPVKVFPPMGSPHTRDMIVKWLAVANVTYRTGREETRFWGGSLLVDERAGYDHWRTQIASAVAAINRMRARVELGSCVAPKQRRKWRPIASVEWIRP